MCGLWNVQYNVQRSRQEGAIWTRSATICFLNGVALACWLRKETVANPSDDYNSWLLLEL